MSSFEKSPPRKVKSTRPHAMVSNTTSARVRRRLDDILCFPFIQSLHHTHFSSKRRIAQTLKGDRISCRRGTFAQSFRDYRYFGGGCGRKAREIAIARDVGDSVLYRNLSKSHTVSQKPTSSQRH